MRRYIIYVILDISLPVIVYFVSIKYKIQDIHFLTLLILNMSVLVELTIEFIRLSNEVKKFASINEIAREHNLNGHFAKIVSFFSKES